MTHALAPAILILALGLGSATAARADEPAPIAGWGKELLRCDYPAPKGYWYSSYVDDSGHCIPGIRRRVPSAVGLSDKEEVECSAWAVSFLESVAQSFYDQCIGQKVAAKRREAEDDAVCKSYGLGFGTPAYAECRENIVNQREATARALIMSRPEPPPIPSVFDPLPPIPLPPEPVTTDCRRIGNMVHCTSQ